MMDVTKPEYTFVLLGSPNCGKTAFFNSLTGSQKKSANYPGITVEISSGVLKLKNSIINLVDLPGIYSLQAQSFDELITRDYLLGFENKFFASSTVSRHFDQVIVVVDETHLEKTLYLAMELKELSIPFQLVFTHHDLAKKRNQKINVSEWEKAWGIKIHQVNNFDKKDFINLLNFWETQKSFPEIPKFDKIPPQISNPKFVAKIFSEIDKTLREFRIQKMSSTSLTERLDNLFLHPIGGIAFMCFILLLLFQLLFTVSAPIQDLIDGIFTKLSLLCSQYLPESFWRDLITEGIIPGVGSVLVFLPQISFLSLLITLLEDSGYLARVAFLLDGLMKRLALPGKAIIPLLSSHACAIPGIMATRNLDREEDRITTMMIVPLTTCSARIPVYTLLIAALIPANLYFGPISYQALILFGLYSLGILTGFAIGFILKRKFFKAKAHQLLLPLPHYKFPRLKNVWLNVKNQSWEFISKAGGIILLLTILIWFLATHPKGNSPSGNDINSNVVTASYVERIGRFIQPVLAPLGFDWKLSAALIPSFAAREVMVSSLATVNAIDEDSGSDNESDENTSKLVNIISKTYSVGTILALLIWFVYAPQCISTFAIIKKETNGYFWPSICFAYSLSLAYIVGYLVKLIFD